MLLNTVVLVVRQATYEADAHGRMEFQSADTEEFLSNTSRKVRIEGLKRMPNLVKEIKSEADGALKAIDDAKKLLK